MEEVIFQEGEQIPEAPKRLMSAPDNGDYKKLVEHCLKLYKEFKDSEYREAQIKQIIESRKAYAQKEEKTNFPWSGASNIVLPLLTITVDNLEPRLVAGITGRDPMVQISMEGRSDKAAEVKIIQDWYNYELQQVVKIQAFVRRFCHRILLEGTVFPIPSYMVQSEIQRDFSFDEAGNVIVGQDGQPVWQDSVIDTGEGGALDMVPFTDMYYPDNVGTAEEWEKCDKMRMIYPTYGQLESLAQDPEAGWFNIGPWMLGEKSAAKEGSEEGDPVQVGRETDNLSVTGKESVKCLECHVSYPIYQDQKLEDDTQQTNWDEEKVIVTIAIDSGVIIRYKLNREVKFRNDSVIKRVRLFADDTKSCGDPVYAKLKGILKGGSDIFNLLINVAYIVMVPFFFYEDRSGVAGQKQIFPGAGIKVDSVQGILFPNFNVNPAQFASFLQIFMSLWERVGHVGDLQIGRPSETAGKNKTATEIMAVIQEGNIQFNYQSTTLKDEFITVLQALYDYYYQYMPLTKTFKSGNQDVPIPRQAMKQGVSFTLGSSTESANKLIERKENEDLLGMFSQDPLMNPVKLREDVLKSYGRTAVEEYIKPEVNELLAAFMQHPEIMQVIQKYMATVQEVAAATGQGEQGGQGAGNPIQ